MPRDLDAVLRAAERGELDTLSPDDVDKLEAALRRDQAAAGRLGRALAKPEARLARALEDAGLAAAPRADEWQRVWSGIDRRLAGAADRRRATSRRWAEVARSLLAAAACLLLAALWQTRAPRVAEPWPLELASDVEIDALEVYGDATPFVVSAGEGDGIEVIWVLEGEG